MANKPLYSGFQRLQNFPLTDTEVFNSLLELETYASENPTAYSGQKCSVVENGVTVEYAINSDKSVASIQKTEEEIEVFGNEIGSYSEGDVIPIYTNVTEVLKNILQKLIPPTYVAPTLTAVDNIAAYIEIGAYITGTITPTFTQNNAGAITSYTVNLPVSGLRTYGAVQPLTLTLSDTEPILSYAINIVLTAYYGEGSILNDNMGNPYPTGQITAGSKTFNVSVAGYKPYFYKGDTGTSAPTTDVQLRALTNSSIEAANGLSFSINIPAGSTRVVFAYRTVYQAVSSVVYVQGGNSQMKDLFTETTISVNGLNGTAPANYRVYTYLPEAAFGDTSTFTVTI